MLDVILYVMLTQHILWNISKWIEGFTSGFNKPTN